MNVDNDLLLVFFEKMLLVRKFEMKVYELAEKGLVRGSVHLTIGEEATAVGACLSLKKEDYIITTHRGHGQELAKGADVNKMLAEMIGKETGLCKGRVGSMHITDREHNNLGAQGIIGASFPISVGVGLAIKLKEMNSILLSFFGDGSTNQGTFYESMNFADLWRLPILFVCINNQYGMGTAYCKTCNTDIYEKGKLFNITSAAIDGNDVSEVYKKTKEFAEMVRKEKRSALLELRTYRLLGHSAFDRKPYRTREEVEEWKKRDPIVKVEEKLLKNKVSPEILEEIKNKVNDIIAAAEKFAIESKYPTYDNSMEQ
jgi:TPP-dependent pyruvate/acetoin dehydrogenase alpha subunit